MAVDNGESDSNTVETQHDDHVLERIAGKSRSDYFNTDGVAVNKSKTTTTLFQSSRMHSTTTGLANVQ